jgi:hypothetical protein
MRTDQQIIDQTNELARILYALRGYQVSDSAQSHWHGRVS